MARPKCLNCGKQLTKNFYGTNWATEHFGFEPLEVKPAGYDPKETVGFYGTYGKDGGNFFCSYKCGHGWAVRVNRQKVTGK
jgi:hypothetical protein